MKKINILLLLTLSLVILFSCKDKVKVEEQERIQKETNRLESRATKLMKILSQSNGYLQWNFTLPSNVAFFTDILGEPDSVFLDKDEFCPIGKVLTWIVEEENITVSIVADSYAPELKPNDEVRLVAFKSMRINKPNSLITLNGIRLDSPEADVLARIKRYIATATDFKSTSYKEPTVFDSKYTAKEYSYHQIQNGSYFFHFAIDNAGILRYVFLSSFNIRESC